MYVQKSPVEAYVCAPCCNSYSARPPIRATKRPRPRFKMSYSLPSGVFRTRIIFLDSNYYFLDCPIGVNLRKPDVFFIFRRLIFPGNLLKCSIPGAFLTVKTVSWKSKFTATRIQHEGFVKLLVGIKPSGRKKFEGFPLHYNNNCEVLCSFDV